MHSKVQVEPCHETMDGAVLETRQSTDGDNIGIKYRVPEEMVMLQTRRRATSATPATANNAVSQMKVYLDVQCKHLELPS